MNKMIFISLFGVILFLIDLYVFQAIKVWVQDWPSLLKKTTVYCYWGLTLISLVALFTYNFTDAEKIGRLTKSIILTGLFVNYFSKLFAVLFLFIDDLIRLGKWTTENLLTSKKVAPTAGNGISRSEFLSKTALVAAAIPAATMGFGILSGAYNYQVRRKEIFLPGLPASFDGLRIAQLSDIHSGSFFDKTAVKGGVDMLLREKPDMIFFTGDLVNNKTKEVEDYIDIFKKVKAPLGVYSTLGNHDYGEYTSWSSPRAKAANFNDMVRAHKILGWDLLMNENRIIKSSGEELAILGIENWGAGRFPKYGKLDEAYKGTEHVPVKLLLSHDPSHWDAQVRPDYKDINIMFSGHTHGFQFGVEIGDFKWSPAQYLYKQWAGLYQENGQYLYVNRGFGFLGFPGRIGMLPEITVITLRKGSVTA